jgi:hypothetical protein
VLGGIYIFKKPFLTTVRKFIVFTLIVSVVVGVPYLIVFKVSFLPNGYDIVEEQKDIISLKSFNVAGVEKKTTTIAFSEKNTWKIDEIKSQVNRQKNYLWLLYAFVSVSLILFFYKVRKGNKLWKAILDSNIIFAVLLPLIPLINTLNWIQKLIS